MFNKAKILLQKVVTRQLIFNRLRQALGVHAAHNMPIEILTYHSQLRTSSAFS